MTITFVILHYGSLISTINCITSIKKHTDCDFRIIIVDNASPNGSGLELKEKFKCDSTVEVILSKENLGFSRGMNLGFEIAKKGTPSAQFIALVNNDTQLLSDNIGSVLEEDYENYNFAVLGPHIDNPSKMNTNPFDVIYLTDEEKYKIVQRGLRILPIKMQFARLNMLLIYSCLSWIKNQLMFRSKIVIKKKEEKEVKECKKGKEDNDESNTVLSSSAVLNCGLHGCFLIFSPKYISLFDGLEPVTFAYDEEWLLYRRCKEANLMMMYDPRIRIWHDEHTVQKSIASSYNKKFLFRAKMELDAMKRIKEFIEIKNKNGTFIKTDC